MDDIKLTQDTSNIKHDLQALRLEIDGALGIIALKKGMELKLANCSYTREGGFTFKLEGHLPGGISREASLYNQAREFDPELPPLGFRYKSGGRPSAHTFTVVGMKSRSGKVLVEDESTGRRYLEKEQSLKMYARLQPKAAEKAGPQ